MVSKCGLKKIQISKEIPKTLKARKTKFFSSIQNYGKSIKILPPGLYCLVGIVKLFD